MQESISLAPRGKVKQSVDIGSLGLFAGEEH